MDLKGQILMEQLNKLNTIEEEIMFTDDPLNRRRLEREWAAIRINILELAKTPYDTVRVVKNFSSYIEFWTKTYDNLQMVYDNCSNRADDPKIKMRWRHRQEQVLKHIERIKEIEPLIDNIKNSLEDS
jgi:hypothetical protein